MTQSAIELAATSELSRSEYRAKISLGQPWLRNLRICSGKPQEMTNGLRSRGSDGKHRSWMVEIPADFPGAMSLEMSLDAGVSSDPLVEARVEVLC